MVKDYTFNNKSKRIKTLSKLKSKYRKCVSK